MSTLAIAITDSAVRRATCPLTERELQILSLLGNGLTYKGIAEEVGVCWSTVRTHLHNIYVKIGVRDRAQAVLIAYRRGWIYIEGDLGPDPEAAEEILLLRHIAQLMDDLLCAVAQRRERLGITRAQEKYLRAFEHYLRSPSGLEAPERRAAMVDRLYAVMDEAGLDPFAVSVTRKGVR